MDIQIAQPWLLSLCILAAVPPLFAWRAAGRGRIIHPLSVICQSAAIILLAVGLGGLSAAMGGKSKAPWLIMRDESGSTRGQDKDVTLPEGVAAKNLNFATWTELVDPGIPQTFIDPAYLKQKESQTNVSGPLRLAATSADRWAGLVVMTDGRFTDSDWHAAAAELGKIRLPTYIIPLDSPPTDARLAGFTAIRRADGQVELRATVASNGAAGRKITIERVWPDRKKILESPLTLLPLEPSAVNCTDNLSRKDMATYLVRLDTADPFPENDSAVASAVPLDGRLALISPTGLPEANRLADAMKMPVEQIAPNRAGDESAGLRQYDAVILVDPDGRAVDGRARKAIAEYVRAGGGLVLAGVGPCESPQDAADPLNQVVALAANPFERCPLRLIVALDSSGSMSDPASLAGGGQRGLAKFELAVQAVVSLERHLTAGDSVAVVSFADKPEVIYDSGAGPEDFSVLAARLYNVRPRGQTDMSAAFAKAAELALLTRPTATSPAEGNAKRQNLLIFVSDLQPNAPSPFEPAATANLLKKSNVSLAIVETSSADESRTTALRELASLAGAQIAPADRLSSLAEVFAQFVRRARGDIVRKAGGGGKFQVSAIGDLFGRAGLVVPPLDSYILCSAEKDAQIQAYVPSAGEPKTGDPVIARRLAGAGRSVSLAVPLGKTGNNSAAIEQMVDIISAAAKWAMRPAQDSRFSVTAGFEDGLISLNLDARDQAGPMNMLNLTAVVQPLRGDSRTEHAPMPQSAPGIYSVKLPCSASSAGLEIKQADGQSLWRGTADKPTPTEYSALGSDWENLRTLAQLAGGQVIHRQQIDEICSARTRQLRQNLLPYFIAAAILLVLLDWLAARVVRRPGKSG